MFCQRGIGALANFMSEQRKGKNFVRFIVLPIYYSRCTNSAFYLLSDLLP